MKKRKTDAATVILVLVFIIGLSLLLYPPISNYWNSFHQSRAIAGYADYVANMDSSIYDDILAQAHKYNESLLARRNHYLLTDEQYAEYESLLNVLGNGIMGYVEIPSLNIALPIYHGVSDAVLSIAAGHIEWTSLPVGGESTHCVLSGHRGLPSAKLFTDLDKLTEGDTFMLRVLNETLTYEVDRILIVSPDDTSELEIVEGKDYCTLITCTPYGINSHRLLVRGHRIENTPDAENVRVTSDALMIEPFVVAPVIFIPVLILIIIPVLYVDKLRLKHREEEITDD